ncbi:MAG: xylulokinase [Thermoproteota archaeon]|nr:xylulokinase [Thermoproteota archaeon]
MSLLGLDIGTSACKSFVYNLEGNVVSSSTYEYTILHPKPSWSELDPEEVWSQIVASIRESILKAKADPKQIQALSVSALGDEIMPVGADLKWTYPTILGYDQRATKQFKDIQEKLGISRIEEITGGRSLSVASNIKWLKEEMPNVYEKTMKLIGWHEYLMWKLCGRPVIDPSLASRTGLYDIRRARWSTEILDALGTDFDHMPDIEFAGTAVGEVQSEAVEETGLARGTAVVVGAHDTPDCALLGAGVVYEDLAIDLTGSFENITAVAPKDSGSLKTLCLGINRTSDIPISSIGTLPSAGSVFKWYRDTFSQEEMLEAKNQRKDVYDLLTAKAAQSPPGSNNLIFLPTFTARDARGAIVGLTLGHRKNDVIRAILEGISYQLRVELERSKERMARIKEIRAVGGGAKSPFWVQLKADVYKKWMVTPSVLEAGSLGAAILAGIGVGAYKDAFEGVNETYREKDVYAPDEKAVKVYDRYFEVYKRLKLSLEPVFADMTSK